MDSLGAKQRVFTLWGKQVEALASHKPLVSHKPLQSRKINVTKTLIIFMTKKLIFVWFKSNFKKNSANHI